jgi:hypothetical protein
MALSLLIVAAILKKWGQEVNSRKLMLSFAVDRVKTRGIPAVFSESTAYATPGHRSGGTIGRFSLY